MGKLTPQHVQTFYAAKLKQGLSPKMVNMLHGVLHKALDTAVKWSLVPSNACDVVSPPRIPKTKKQVLTVDQAFLTLVRAHQLEALLALALTTAMRRGELLALRWHEVNLETHSLQVTRTVDYIPHYGFVESEPKTDKGNRPILLAGFVVGLLRQHRHKQEEQRQQLGSDWVEKDLVFPNRSGDYFSPNTLLKMFRRFLKQAELPHLRFHDLRHSAATLLLSMGVHPKIVQEILGHSHISQTLDTYSHVLPSMQKEVIVKWDEVFDP